MAWHVHYVDATGSTNADLLAMAADGAPAGTVLHAGHQTAGRGRLGRSWQAPPGASLLVSVLLRPGRPASFWDVATVALAAADACRATAGVEAGLKWPNDLVVGDRKLAGVLAEADAAGAVVVGCGLNVAWPAVGDLPPDLRGTLVALSHLVAGPPPSVADVLDALLVSLAGWQEAAPAALREAYAERSATLGHRVRVERHEGPLEGVAQAIDGDGALVVDGQPVAVGDVVHLRPA